MRAFRLVLSLSMLANWPVSALAQRPQALADSDLVVAGVPFPSDTVTVRARLGEPSARNATSWVYGGLVVYFDAQGKLRQVQLTSARFATARGLRVGDSADHVTRSYGASCYQGTYTYCRTVGADFDARGIRVSVRRGRVARIIVGAVFET